MRHIFDVKPKPFQRWKGFANNCVFGESIHEFIATQWNASDFSMLHINRTLTQMFHFWLTIEYVIDIMNIFFISLTFPLLSTRHLFIKLSPVLIFWWIKFNLLLGILFWITFVITLFQMITSIHSIPQKVTNLYIYH